MSKVDNKITAGNNTSISTKMDGSRRVLESLQITMADGTNTLITANQLRQAGLIWDQCKLLIRDIPETGRDEYLLELPMDLRDLKCSTRMPEEIS